MPIARLCVVVGCHNYRAPNARHGGCQEHDAIAERRDSTRRRAKPQRKIWDSPEWKRTRRIVWQRDGHRCRHCGRHRTQLKQNEKLIADHIDGVQRIVAEGRDPYDPNECQTLCSTCSGEKDGRLSQGAAGS